MVTREPVDILLVDDQPARLLTYEAILGPLGHRLVTAASGMEALKKLMDGKFAVILLDVSMPVMDGFETARLIHEHPRFEGTPIIFVTGVHVSELDKLKGYSLGAVDYVYVPVVPEILRSKVAVLVELHGQRIELQRLNESLSKANAELDEANQALQREKARELAALNRSLEEANRDLVVSNETMMNEIAERRRVERELLDADRQKDAFLAILAHELRNPLAPIRSAIMILQREGSDDPMLVKMRQVIDRQVQHMTRLIDDLLEVSRITQGKINLKLEPVDVAVVARQAVETTMPEITARGHGIVVSAPGKPLHVNGDAVRLAQVIGNLVSNAAKFTPDGGRIELQVGVEGDLATIAVRDTGIGIAQEYMSHIFELFGQVRNPRPHSHDGLGIGLALAQRIVEMHQGQVEARSKGENLGSEFIVRLPLLQRQSARGEARQLHRRPMAATHRPPDPHRRRFRRLSRQPGRHAAAGRQRSPHGAERGGCAGNRGELRAGDHPARPAHAGHGWLRGGTETARIAPRQGRSPDRSHGLGAAGVPGPDDVRRIRCTPDEAAGPRSAVEIVRVARARRGGVNRPRGTSRVAVAREANRVDFAAVAAEEESRKPLYSRPVMRRRGLPFQARIVLLTLAGGLPALLAAFLLLRDAPIADSVHRLVVVLLVGAWVGFAIAVHKATVEPLRSIANLLEALRGGDYAIRGRHGRKGDALGDIVLESNRLGATLRSQRFEAIEVLRAPQQGAVRGRRRGVRLRRRRADPPREPGRRRAAAAPPGRADRAVGGRRSASNRCSRDRRSRASRTPSRAARAAGR